jgi:hypothetical protein
MRLVAASAAPHNGELKAVTQQWHNEHQVRRDLILHVAFAPSSSPASARELPAKLPGKPQEPARMPRSGTGDAASYRAILVTHGARGRQQAMANSRGVPGSQLCIPVPWGSFIC